MMYSSVLKRSVFSFLFLFILLALTGCPSGGSETRPTDGSNVSGSSDDDSGNDTSPGDGNNSGSGDESDTGSEDENDSDSGGGSAGGSSGGDNSDSDSGSGADTGSNGEGTGSSGGGNHSDSGSGSGAGSGSGNDTGSDGGSAGGSGGGNHSDSGSGSGAGSGSGNDAGSDGGSAGGSGGGNNSDSGSGSDAGSGSGNDAGSSDGSTGGSGGENNSGSDSESDVGSDSNNDAGSGTGNDSSSDTGNDASDEGSDNTGSDVGTDAGSDSSSDSGSDGALGGGTVVDKADQDVSGLDAARLLTQATFGPTTAEIAHLKGLNNLDAWLDEQFALPPSYHLSLVKNKARNGFDVQRARYPVWWDIALHADDQLRQRVAFALSEIMVVSDIPDALINHGNMLSAYYDVLVENSFGNFRDLLGAVTLNPAMGVYLSMLGNEKPDSETGRRADENYAREVMQLFSIGLVELNQDGSTKMGVDGKPIPTYEQSDVADLARVFTGWSWDRPEFKTSSVDGWYPDLSRMERPMIAFDDYHDTDEKIFLGVTLPPGQTAQQDMDAALDVIFNHPNVGPFIGKQLIQRLVTSNPSSGYISRVSAAFNDNGQGVRGDMQAVIRVILLDPEARGISTDPDFGKLREPLLRFSHIWRAFKVQDPIKMRNYRGLMSQHAPLTARSVFNFFDPGYSPPGVVKDAGLVAPEFQINSETKLNSINSLLLAIIRTDGFYKLFRTRLNLETEFALLDTPDQLLDHLDILLVSGGMSSEFRQILLDYIAQNETVLSDDVLLRGLISLIITSAEYSIQR